MSAFLFNIKIFIKCIYYPLHSFYYICHFQLNKCWAKCSKFPIYQTGAVDYLYAAARWSQSNMFTSMGLLGEASDSDAVLNVWQ